MIALVRVELVRLLGRRLLWVLTALLLIGCVIAGIGAFVTSENSPSAVAGIEAERKAAVDQCIAGMEGSGELRDQSAEEFCEENVFVSDPRFKYRDTLEILAALGVPLMMVGLVMGASFVGADWHSRTMTTLLTWEPRRHRVLLAKALVAFVLIALWVIALQAAFLGAMYPAAALKGSTAGLTQPWWIDLGELILRAAGLAGIAALFGFAIAAAGRNTAAALGASFVYLAFVESLIRGFRPQWVDWLIGDNAALVLVGPEDVPHLGHSQAAAAVLLGVYALALVGGALLVFRRREVA